MLMKLIVDREEFYEALGKVKSATEKKSALPMLRNVLIQATSGKVMLKATDLENYLVYEVKARVLEEGSVALPADKLTAIFKNLVGVEASLELKDEKVIIQAGRSTFKLAVLNPEDFPEFPQPIMDSSLPPEIINRAIDKVEYAISKEDSRYALQGMLIRGVGDKTHFVGSDGTRLALYEGPIESTVDVIIPRKSLKVLKNLVKDQIHDLSVGKDESFLHIGGEGFILSVRLLEGEYPDYLSVIPQDFNAIVLADAELLRGAIKRLSSIAEGSAFPVKVSFLSGAMLLEISEPEYGEGTEEIEIDYDGPSIELGFNGKHLLEALDSFDVDKVYIKVVDADSPVVIEAEDYERDPYRCVIMPMRL